MKEIILSKSMKHKGETESIIIRIEDELPNIFDLGELYNPQSYFKDQAQKLSDALFDALPWATIAELITILVRRMYGIDENNENILKGGI